MDHSQLFKSWFQNIETNQEKYIHFDPPFSFSKRKNRLKSELLNKEHIVKHAFYPFISTTLKVFKFKKVDGERKTIKKLRDISYAGHYDRLILSWYAYILQQYYEKVIEDLGISKCITGYRKFIISDKVTGKKRGSSNIDFAKEVFDSIEQIGPCSVLTFDIENFFSSLDRSILKSKRKQVLGVDELPNDHYHLFKILTHFQTIDKKAITNKLNIKGWKKNEVAKRGYLYDKNDWVAIRSFFLDKKLVDTKLVYENKLNGKGIPQGSSMSAVLSNMYMIDFDSKLLELANKLGALYRRYSDDIIIVCPNDKKQIILGEVYSIIKDLKLVIHREKEDRTIFDYDESGILKGYYDMDDEKNKNRNSKGKYLCMQKREGNKECINLGCDFKGRCKTIQKKVQYLGFLFDGQEIEIRPGSMSNYWQRMINGIKKMSYQARGKNSRSPKLYRKKLLIRYTSLISTYFKNNTSNPITLNNSNNFITYAKRSYKVTKSIRIKKQYKNHMNKFHALISRYMD